jgi:hypothetical protein
LWLCVIMCPGDVVSEETYQKCIKPDGEFKGKSVGPKDIIRIKNGGTGFAARDGEKAQVKKHFALGEWQGYSRAGLSMGLQAHFAVLAVHTWDSGVVVEPVACLVQVQMMMHACCACADGCARACLPLPLSLCLLQVPAVGVQTCVASTKDPAAISAWPSPTEATLQYMAAVAPACAIAGLLREPCRHACQSSMAAVVG